MSLGVETPDSRCLHCGAHVSPAFARVHGDNQDRAHRCTRCDSHIRIAKGSAAGLAVTVPDPEIAEGRHGGDSS
ncbi:hypothetical protein C2R22_05720 [Salinigranum rubrum]|uniref:Small CPxCG-related zinc finger protein n=1 Tax=Salinigranum rubrum TaxID=755307 RepID=A0A2I8VPP2_9EURY|nr:hypothetical protein C2R22_05720 [Salinigranum rubrum]